MPIRPAALAACALVLAAHQAIAQSPAATPPDVVAAIAHLNAIRATEHLAPVTLDLAMTRACALHANYLVTNEGRPEIAGLRAHEEVASLPGYTDEGAAAGRAADLDEQGPLLAIDAWINSLYHRTPMLRPSLRRVGMASAGSGEHVRTVLMFDDAADPSAGYPIVYPVDGQNGVPLDFGDERPNPVPLANSEAAGAPLTIAFGPLHVASVTAQLTDASNSPVPFWLSTPDQPATNFPQGGVVCVIPREHLRPATTYHAHVVVLGFPPFDWHFTTVAPTPIVATDFAAAERAEHQLVSVRGDVLSTGTIRGNRYLEIARVGSRSMYVLIPDETWPQLVARGIHGEGDFAGQRVDVVGEMTRADDGSLSVVLNAAADLQISNAPVATVDANSNDLLTSMGRLVTVRGRVAAQGHIAGFEYLQLTRDDGRMVSVMIPDALWSSLSGAVPDSFVGFVITARTTPQMLNDGSIDLDVTQRSQLTWSRP